jgi:hypothetical protein
MQPNDTSKFSLQIKTDWNNVVHNLVQSTERAFIVSNGNVKGNRVDPNPVAFTVREFGYRRGNHRQIQVDYDYKVKVYSAYSGVIGFFQVQHLPNTDPSQDNGRLRDNCMEKIYDQIKGNSNFVVDLAESAATLKMLKSTLSLRGLIGEFWKAIVSTKKYKRTSGQRRIDYVSQKWLEYRYGWNPLVQSIYDALETLAGDHLTNQPVPVKARSSVSRNQSTRSGQGTFGNPIVTTVSSLNHRYEIKLLLKPKGPSLTDFTSLNPIGIAWELLPLSFIGDWVWNVSQYLDLWENYFIWNSQFRSGYVTDTYIRETVQTRTGNTASQIQYYPDGTPVPYTFGNQYLNDTCYQVEKGKNRTKLTSLPWPSGMRLNISLGAKRQLDAAALIHAFTRGK